MKVLLVDNEYLEREALDLIITENLPCVDIVDKLSSGKESVNLFKDLNPNVIFMDIKMPELNGIDTSKEIKKIDPNVKIILLTAYDEFTLAHQAIKLGIDDYILKPANEKDIINALNKQIKNIKNTDGLENNERYIPKSRKIKTVIDYINNNLDKKISLNELAKMVNLEKNYLSRLFKKETDISFVDYVTMKKINKAKNMLKNSNIPILNIALDLGYKNSNYFSRVFKKSEDISPTEFRKKSR